MSVSYATELYGRIHHALTEIPIVDCHEHLQRESELPEGADVHIGRFFVHYANCDLVSAGMPARDMARVQDDRQLTPRERWALLAPWYRKAWNTAYCESLRIAIRDLYGIEELDETTVDALTDAMRSQIRPGFTRTVFDRAGIDIAMNNPFGPKLTYNPDFDPRCFIVDMVDGGFTRLSFAQLATEFDTEVLCFDDYLRLIDKAFDRHAATASAFKVGRAYERTLFWEDVPSSQAEAVFNRWMSFDDQPSRSDVRAAEDYVLHYLCRKCGEHGLRMKFHTGLQEGNGNIITNSRAALMANLLMKYPHTGFDIYHLSYPYQDELITLAKNFPNVTIDFCWMWIINPAAGRRALSEMLDAVPASKIHGFGGDYIFVEGTYGHAVIARREIARVLAEKVEEGRFSEDYALEVGRMLLRDNAVANFGLQVRRKAFKALFGKSV